MPQHYSDPTRANEPYALPDVEVFYAERGDLTDPDPFGESSDGVDLPAGWYYWHCFPGCLPDGDPVGPFPTEADALADARAHNE